MSEEEEQYCKYVSTRGIPKSCDIKSSWFRSSMEWLEGYDFSKVKPRDTIYVNLAAMHAFCFLIDSIPNEFILVTGDCDRTSPNDLFHSQHDFEFCLNHPKLIHWYSQNGVLNHPKFTRIPIGLDYHTLTQKLNNITAKHQEKYYFDEIRKRAQPLSNRLVKCYGNFHFNIERSKFGYERKNAIDKIPKRLLYLEPTRTTKYETFLRQAQYAFVVSPAGNGLDCYRTWEALCLGCIPIVKSCLIDSLFDDLPVLIVNDWTEITLELLYNTLDKVATTQYNYDKLTLKYWMDKINEYKTKEHP